MCYLRVHFQCSYNIKKYELKFLGNYKHINYTEYNIYNIISFSLNKYLLKCICYSDLKLINDYDL